MKKEFTTEEVYKASMKLKNNKSPGSDNLQAEQVKHAPPELAKIIAGILNTTAATGDHPKEIKAGILNPQQKPGKKKGPCPNLRPIILLNTLRKILAISSSESADEYYSTSQIANQLTKQDEGQQSKLSPSN